MKIAGFEKDGIAMVGLVEVDGTVRTLGQREEFWRNPENGMSAGAGESAGLLSDLHELPAIPVGAKVICVGLNYRLHAEETNMPIPTVPIIFSRWTSSLSTDGVPAPKMDDKFDYEVELGAVIGRKMFRVDAQDATGGIFGYAAFNDISARSLQMQTHQWTLGKNCDASGPMSPIVTADEVDPIKGLRVTTHVNGKLRQDSNTTDMIFTVPEIIAHLSQAMTLEPGDFIVTGTPSGVAMATGEFLQVGDEVVVEVEGIGRVRTPISEPPPTVR
jgi:2,4-didehydro-3-deoxy-L-rhamnonate hydrolase